MTTSWLRPIGMAVGASFGLAGCGGGGGGGGGPGETNLPLTLSVAPVSASVDQIDLPSSVNVNASVSGTTSATTLYVVIVDANATFTGTPVVNQTGPGQYQASLTLSDQLTIGTHSGSLQVSICSDAGCAGVLGKTTASYTVTIAQNPVVTGTWSRASVSLTAVTGDAPVSWPLTLTTPVEKYIPYAQFSDAANVVSVVGDSQTILEGYGTSTVALTVASSVAPGTYTGNLNMVYCRDPACKQMYSGVTQLPYSVTVYAATNNKALTPLSGATDWQGLQGSAAHTGFVPVTLNPANFLPRWQWSVPGAVAMGLTQYLAPVTFGGKLFTIAVPPSNSDTPYVYAIDETTGTPDWQQPITNPGNGPSLGQGALTPPVIAGNTVYVASTDSNVNPQEGVFSAFSVTDGTSAFTPQIFTDVPGQYGDDVFGSSVASTNVIPVYLTPRNGTMVFEVWDSQFNKSFVKSDLTTGVTTPEWTTCAAANTTTPFGGAVAVDSTGKSYIATPTGLLMPDACVSISTNGLSLANGNGPALVPGTSDVIAIGDGNLVDFDTSAQQVKWSVAKSATGTFENSAAVVGTTVYVLNAGTVQLEARSESTGEVLWSWHPTWPEETGFLSNVVATNNLVFVSTGSHTYAIDTTSHQAVWMYPYAAKQLVISANGVLYLHREGVIAGAWAESMEAINLQ